VVVKHRAGPLQLVDERDQVLHSGDVRSGQVEVGVGGREIGGRRTREEVSQERRASVRGYLALMAGRQERREKKDKAEKMV
jgi:hypothetical protein